MNTRYLKITFVSLSATLLTTGCSIFGLHSEENPSYQVVAESDGIQVRKYAPQVIAKTATGGEYRDSMNSGFRVLAGYIFGKNKKNQDIAMTAPVLRKPEVEDESQKIAMTAPVLRVPENEGSTMVFFMPSKYKLEDLPQPLDERVKLEEIPERYVAAIDYSWFSSESKNKRYEEKVRAWLEKNPKFQAKGEAFYAGYDPPWTLPFSRTHEVMIEVEPVKTN